MKKIISLFERDYDSRHRTVFDQVVEGAEWVQNGEGTPTRKYDGTCCLIRDGKLYRRYEVKRGKSPPEGFEPATDVDPNTGKQQGWLAVGDGQQDRWHNEAFATGVNHAGLPLSDGTYELCGPKIQGNPEGFESHVLVRHGVDMLVNAPTQFEELKCYLADHDIEGIVWHHPDGRMVKIKGKDFGIVRGGH